MQPVKPEDGFVVASSTHRFLLQMQPDEALRHVLPPSGTSITAASLRRRCHVDRKGHAPSPRRADVAARNPHGIRPHPLLSSGHPPNVNHVHTPLAPQPSVPAFQAPRRPRAQTPGPRRGLPDPARYAAPRQPRNEKTNVTDRWPRGDVSLGDKDLGPRAFMCA